MARMWIGVQRHAFRIDVSARTYARVQIELAFQSCEGPSQLRTGRQFFQHSFRLHDCEHKQRQTMEHADIRINGKIQAGAQEAWRQRSIASGD